MITARKIDADQDDCRRVPAQRRRYFLRGQKVSFSDRAKRVTWASKPFTRTWPWPKTWTTVEYFPGTEVKKRYWAVWYTPWIATRCATNRSGSVAAGYPHPSLAQQIRNLSGGQRQAVAIARTIYWNAKMVIMDEPTAALGVSEQRKVLKLGPHTGRTGRTGNHDQPQHAGRIRRLGPHRGDAARSQSGD